MIQKGEHEMQRTSLLKAARAAIRLKHSIAADEEINRVLPEVEKEINAALQAGTAYELDVASLLGDA